MSSEVWLRRLPESRAGRVVAVDTHTEGELTRVVLDGGPSLPDLRASEQRSYFAAHYDDWRRKLTWEPRGHRDLEVAWLSKSQKGDCDLRVFFMDARRYPLACGTATMGAVVAAVELGMVAPGQLKIDTPSGLVGCHAKRNNDAIEVTLDMVPACLTIRDESLQVGSQSYRAHLGFVGGFLLLLDSSQLTFPLERKWDQEIIGLGEELVLAATQQWEVTHPISGEDATVDGVVFFDSTHHSQLLGRGAVVYGDAHLDRSPCGTGTTVKIALLQHQGLISIGQEFRNKGLLDTMFTGHLHELVQVGAFGGVKVSLKGTAHLVAFHEFFTGPGDELSGGFQLGERER